MKKLLILAITLATISTTASAIPVISEKSEWSEILKNKKVHLVQPKLAEAFGPRGLFNACVNADEIKSITPVNVCLNYEDITQSPNTELEYIDQKCTRSTILDAVIDKIHTAPVCLKHTPPSEISSNECISWGTKTVNLPDTYSIEVVRAERLEAGNHLFNKMLVLPSCE